MILLCMLYIGLLKLPLCNTLILLEELSVHCGLSFFVEIKTESTIQTNSVGGIWHCLSERMWFLYLLVLEIVFKFLWHDCPLGIRLTPQANYAQWHHRLHDSIFSWLFQIPQNCLKQGGGMPPSLKRVRSWRTGGKAQFLVVLWARVGANLSMIKWIVWGRNRNRSKISSLE